MQFRAGSHLMLGHREYLLYVLQIWFVKPLEIMMLGMVPLNGKEKSILSELWSFMFSMWKLPSAHRYFWTITFLSFLLITQKYLF